ncbi:hypothetical protein MPH_12012 [Macrophomina phaseolina MS6]|uniref:Uncharacterized protein n=1 Tax=Macrophomina phaseolina (strain MS6) TaxID=1126212 RepID=K2RLI6_MACPH|nr:hypothetical protein MPH_12012 [Macrophomina phaseolina MS6]
MPHPVCASMLRISSMMAECSEWWPSMRPAIHSGWHALFKHPSCGFDSDIPHTRLACHSGLLTGRGSRRKLLGMEFSSRMHAVWYSWFELMAAQCTKRISGNGFPCFWPMVLAGRSSRGRSLSQRLSSCQSFFQRSA